MLVAHRPDARRRDPDVPVPDHRQPGEFEPIGRRFLGPELAAAHQFAGLGGRPVMRLDRHRLLGLLPRPRLARHLLPPRGRRRRRPHLADRARPGQRRARRAAPLRRPAGDRRGRAQPPARRPLPRPVRLLRAAQVPPRRRRSRGSPSRARRAPPTGWPAPTTCPPTRDETTSSTSDLRPGRPTSARSRSSRSRSCTRSRRTAAGDRRRRDLAYSGDTGPCPAPRPGRGRGRPAARRGGLPRRRDNPPDLHLTGADGGALATRAGVGGGWCSPTSRRGTTREVARCARRPRARTTAPSSWRAGARLRRSSCREAGDPGSHQAGVVHADRDLHPVGGLRACRTAGTRAPSRWGSTGAARRRSRRCSARADGQRDLVLALGEAGEPAPASAVRGGSPARLVAAAGGSACAVTDGDSIGSPAATLRMASTISGGGVSLSRNPSAPAARAPTTCSSASKVVSTMTRGGSGSACSRRVASSPLSCGIRMSISTTSGWRSPRGRRRPRPSPASPTTSMSPWPPSISVSAERTSGSSSTIRTRGHAAHGIQPCRTNVEPSGVLEPAAARSARSASPISPSPAPGVRLAPKPIGLRSTTSMPSSGDPTRMVSSAPGACLRRW